MLGVFFADIHISSQRPRFASSYVEVSRFDARRLYLPNQPYQDALHLLDAHINILDYTSVKHTRWHVSATTFLLERVQTLQDDPFSMCQTVSHVREILMRVTGRHVWFSLTTILHILSCVVRIVADGLCLALPYLGDIFADTKPEALIEPGHTTAIGQGHRDSVSIDAVWRSVSAHLWPPPAHSAKGDNVLQGLMPPLTALIPGWLPTPDPLQCGDSKHNEKNT